MSKHRFFGESSIFVALALIVLAAVLFIPSPSLAAEQVPYSATFAGGDLTWEVDVNNKLIIRPTSEGGSGLIPNLANGLSPADAAAPRWPWHAYRGQIRSIQVLPGVGVENELRGIFCNCPKLTSVDLNGLDMSGATVINDMFFGCYNLPSINLSSCQIGTSLTQMSRAFASCTALHTVNLAGADLSNVTTASNVFNSSGSLSRIVLSGSKLSSTACGALIKGKEALTYIDLSGAVIPSSSVSGLIPSGVETLNLSGFSLSDSGSMSGILSGLANLKTLDLSNITISSDLSGFTSGLFSLQSLDLTGFANSPSYRLDIGSLPVGVNITLDNTPCMTVSSGLWKVDGGDEKPHTELSNDILDENGRLQSGGTLTRTGMGYVEGTINGQVKWKIENGVLTVWPANGTSGTLSSFPAGTPLPWRQFAPSITAAQVQGTVNSAGSLAGMFEGCSNMASVDLSGLNLSAASNLSGMFNGCSSLTSVDLSCTDARVISENMFKGCSSLTTLNVSGITATGVKLPFTHIPAITTIIAENASITFAEKERNNPFTGDGQWQCPSDSGTEIMDFHEVLANSLTISGTYEKVNKAAAGFENLEKTFYVIENLNDYVLEINGNIIFSDTDPSDPNITFASDTAGYYVVKKGTAVEIYTRSQSVTDWTRNHQIHNAENEPGYEYDMIPGAADIRITFRNAVRDVNGEYSDMVMEIDKFTFFHTDWPPLLTSSLEDTGYRRWVLGVDIGSLIFRNYVRKPDDLTTNVGNRGSGTETEATVYIPGADPNQSFLFFVEDLDVTRRNKNGNNKDQKGVPGMEGVLLRDGFDLDTLTLASNTQLRTYYYDPVTGYKIATYATINDNLTDYGSGGTAMTLASLGYGTAQPGNAYGNYITGIGSHDDAGDSRGRFYVVADAAGASFTWTSGVNCNTYFLNPAGNLQVWEALEPVPLRLKMEKALDGTLASSDYDSEFAFEMTFNLAHLREQETDGTVLLKRYAPGDGHDLSHIPMGGIQSYANGVITLKDMDYDRIGTYWYTIREIPGNDPDILYDDHEYSLKIQIQGANSDFDMVMGYEAKIYLDDELVHIAHAPTTLTFKQALGTLSGFTDADIEEKTWTDSITGDVFVFDPSQERWVCTDTQGDAWNQDPSAHATADFTITWQQAKAALDRAELRGYAGPSVMNLQSKTWVDSSDNYQYSRIQVTWQQAKDRSYNHEIITAVPWVDDEGNTYTHSTEIPYGDVALLANTYYEGTPLFSIVSKGPWHLGDDQFWVGGQISYADAVLAAEGNSVGFTSEHIKRMTFEWSDHTDPENPVRHVYTYDTTMAGWVDSATGELLDMDEQIPDDALARAGSHPFWIKNNSEVLGAWRDPSTGDSAVSGVPAYEPDPEMLGDSMTIMAFELSAWWKTDSNGIVTKVEEPPASARSDFYAWLRNKGTAHEEPVLSPSSDSVATFTLPFSYMDYVENNGFSQKELESFTWVWVDESDPDNPVTHTYTSSQAVGWVDTTASGSTLVAQPHRLARVSLWEEAYFTLDGFDNRTVYDLVIEKIISGNMGSKTRKFDFTITLIRPDGSPMKGFVAEGLTENPRKNGVYSFSLGHEDSVTLERLPYGTSYLIEEAVADGYTAYLDLRGDVVGVTRGALSIADDGITKDSTLTVTNVKDNPVPTGIFLSLAPALLGLAAAALLIAVLLLGRRRRRE